MTALTLLSRQKKGKGIDSWPRYGGKKSTVQCQCEKESQTKNMRLHCKRLMQLKTQPIGSTRNEKIVISVATVLKVIISTVQSQMNSDCS